MGDDGNPLPSMKDVYTDGLNVFVDIAKLLIDYGALGIDKNLDDNTENSLEVHTEAMEQSDKAYNNGVYNPEHEVWRQLTEYIKKLRNPLVERRQKRREQIARTLASPMQTRDGSPVNLDARPQGLDQLPKELADLTASFVTGDDKDFMYNLSLIHI